MQTKLLDNLFMQPLLGKGSGDPPGIDISNIKQPVTSPPLKPAMIPNESRKSATRDTEKPTVTVDEVAGTVAEAPIGHL